jgi:hypothetical protein
MFDVGWVESAVFRLADSWLRADPTQRAAITAASHRIEQALRSNPLEAGESRDAERRIFIDDPLAVIYEVDESCKSVTVLDALVRRPRSDS